MKQLCTPRLIHLMEWANGCWNGWFLWPTRGRRDFQQQCTGTKSNHKKRNIAHGRERSVGSATQTHIWSSTWWQTCTHSTENTPTSPFPEQSILQSSQVSPVQGAGHLHCVDETEQFIIKPPCEQPWVHSKQRKRLITFQILQALSRVLHRRPCLEKLSIPVDFSTQKGDQIEIARR